MSDEEVLRAALPVVFGKGPGEFTLAQVAAVTGLSPATLLQRFGSKEALTMAAFRLTNQGHFAALAALPQERGAEAIIAILLARTPGPEHQHRLPDQLVWLRESMRPGELNRISQDYFAAFRAALAARMPPVPGLDPPRAVLLLEGQWHGAMIQWGITGTGDLRDHVEQALRDWFSLALGR